ncbi:histone-lysine N-methyltransferase NSD2 isoform X2 [Cylas formicarius]|nr:histone-lysine N-methyltransferase NSD2 isoform X2 [Cylas formicarius]
MRVYQMGGTENTPGKTRYHIRFFNDSGRRAWIPQSHLLPYRNSNDLDSLVHGAKRAESIKFRIRPNHLHKWKIAIDQIEFYKNKTFRQVHSFLVNSSAKKKQMKQLLEKGTDTKVDFPQTPDKHLDIKFKIDERSATEEPVENRDVRVSVSTDRSVGNVQDLSAQHADAGEAEMPPGKFIEEAPIKNEGRKSVLINVKSENSDLGLKNRAVRSEDPNKYSFEYQTDLHRKNNLFNGLTKVKVCNYCLKEGAIYKCKGQCREYFHNACAAKVTEPRPQRGRKRKIYDESQGNIKPSRVINTMPHKRITRDQVEIVTVKSRVRIASPKKTVPSNFDEMSLGDRIDYQMKAMMSPFENQVMYMDSSTDSSSEEGSVQVPLNINFQTRTPRKTNELPNMFDHDRDDSNVADPSILSEEIDPKTKRIKHVTADSVIEDVDASMFKCGFCKANRDPPCFICGLETSKRGITRRQKCTLHRCGKYYHTRCLKMWPQTQWSFSKWSRDQKNEDSFTCPAHICHTCFSEELGGGCSSRFPVDKLARCLRCPAAFHTSSFCIPAGTEIVGGNQIVCPRHRNGCQPLNTTWCFICSEGGNLVCCDMCPTSVHPECQPIHFTDDDKYICEDCESGRFPLYDEIMWVKLGSYPWWPALILFPNEVPENVRILKHQRGDFVVRFFGTYDHYWVSKARSFLFQEGDQGASPGQVIRSRKPAYETFEKAIQDAAIVYKLKKEFKLRREAEGIGSLKPPPYIKISKNKPVGNVRVSDMDLSNTTACECDPNSIYPCGPDSYCINRLLMTECDPDICPAASRCMNQSFEKREYTPLVPYKTQGRGWGLKCLKAIKKGQFIIEYVGELIDGEEYQRRIKKMHEQKEENYYFMTIDNDRIIDAGPKGNLSRFMNHSCNPNCETQKWTVKGDTRVGLFAIQDVDIGSELTFNYNLECVGQERKLCQCGALNCSGFIGIKAKPDPVATENNIRKSNRKKTESPIPVLPACFICGKDKSDLACRHKSCDKAYHLDCLDLTNRTEGSRFICPRHNCNMCAKRTMRFCVKCINSYCPSHSDGNVRYDKLLGFICKFHDPKKVISEAATTKKTPKLPRTKRFKNSPNDPEAQARRAVSKLPEKNRRGVAS